MLPTRLSLVISLLCLSVFAGSLQAGSLVIVPTFDSSIKSVISWGNYINALKASKTSSSDTTTLAHLGLAANGSDGTVSVNSSVLNLTRTGTQNAKLYDLETVLMHEIEKRSFSTASKTTAYFSLDGIALLDQFNDTGSGDYGDWVNSSTAQVQDVAATAGKQANLNAELRALDVIGYTLAVALQK